MSNSIKEKSTKQRKQEKVAADIAAREAAKQSQSGIRCYGGAGFFAPVTQEDGTVQKKFIYGRDGD